MSHKFATVLLGILCIAGVCFAMLCGFRCRRNTRRCWREGNPCRFHSFRWRHGHPNSIGLWNRFVELDIYAHWLHCLQTYFIQELLSYCSFWLDGVGASELVTRWTRHRWRVHCRVFHFCDEFTVWRLHPVTTSLWRVIRLMFTLLYISCRCAVSVSCCCVLMVYTRKPILGWFFRYYFMSHFKAEMHQIRFRLGLRHRPRWGSLLLQRSSRPSGFKRLYF